MLRKIFKVAGWSLATLLLVMVALVLYVVCQPEAKPPVPASLTALKGQVIQAGPGLFKLGNDWFRKSESGLYELYLEGEPFERGVANGKLTHDLVQYQEEVFTRQLHRLVPSDLYLRMLKYLVIWFNRDLTKNVQPEYQLEIYGVSLEASHNFDDIAPGYQRILNYHAAHDIGHALQNISLVGCTSFATWANQSEDSSLIVGRNFDFYLGDEFARDKIVAFYNPSKGHKFMMVTFGGMTGVLSGMNDQGLTVSLNAAKSDIVFASATPVSLVAREILQYASTLEEAYSIASKRKTFVAESFLIGSAKDGKAAIIEKSPDATDIYQTPGNSIICTNHFQGKKLGNTPLNEAHKQSSASTYRMKRVRQLLDRQQKNSVLKTAALMRNQQGLDDANIGLGNEKSVNQLIAHHGIIFQPSKQLVWVSTAPWQLGKFVCYDLKKIFSLKMDTDHEVYETEMGIPADTFLLSSHYRDYLKFKPYRFPFTEHPVLQPDSIVKWNPYSYQAYMLAGDFYFEHHSFAEAVAAYEQGLSKEVATHQERKHMEMNLQSSKEKLNDPRYRH